MSWGLVLSGGMALGLANAGVVEVLERENLRPDCIGGSSMGAIVAALHALGHPSAHFRVLLEALSIRNAASMSEAPLKGGLHGGLLRQNLETLLAPLIGSACIGDCTVPFLCVAGRVKKPIDWTSLVLSGSAESLPEHVELHVFPPDTPVMDALRATSAVPVLFSPVRIGGDEFVDLVTFGAVPARTLRTRFGPDRVIATDTVPRYASVRGALPRFFDDFLRAGHESLRESLDSCDLVIRPDMPASMVRFDKGPQIAEAGKKATEALLPEIRKLVTAP